MSIQFVYVYVCVCVRACTVCVCMCVCVCVCVCACACVRGYFDVFVGRCGWVYVCRYRILLFFCNCIITGTAIGRSAKS